MLFNRKKGKFKTWYWAFIMVSMKMLFIFCGAMEMVVMVKKSVKQLYGHWQQ